MHYYSDANPTYRNLQYSGKHFYFRGRSHTFTVESINSDLRKYIAALHRRSKCFFCSLETFQAVMRVFVLAYSKFGEFKQLFPRIKAAVDLTQFCLAYNLGTPPKCASIHNLARPSKK